ncbi:MAG TPA: glutamate--tRNA ligase, partial [Thermodesulfatator atlanticus]|nr:glutamate--tRNA ligase [Thermodesulfatator atlanticus]
YEEKAARKFLTPKIVPILAELIKELENLPSFEEKDLERLFRGLAEKHQIKLKHIAQPVRVALTGRTVSPGLFEIMDVLGRETVLKRLRKALEYAKEAPDG